jgi:hypothetical protein
MVHAEIRNSLTMLRFAIAAPFLDFFDQKLLLTQILQREAIKDPMFLSTDFLVIPDIKKAEGGPCRIWMSRTTPTSHYSPSSS